MEFNEYYIAYFDVLGCKSYFSGDERAEFDFVQKLKGMVNTAIECAKSINCSPVLSSHADMHIEYRLFSDNIALYMKVGKSQLEIVRLLTFLEAISSAQRDTLFTCKLLLRGGVVKGRLCSDDSFFVGKGLIDAVAIEESTMYPRISLDSSIVNAVSDLTNVQFDSPYLTKDGMMEWFMGLILQAEEDDKCYLNYLTVIEPDKVYPVLKSECRKIAAALKQTSSENFEMVQKDLMLNRREKLEEYLLKHKDVVLEKIKNDCNYETVDKKDPKIVAAKAKVIQKIKWLVVLHNRLFYLNKKTDLVINISYTFDPVTLNDYMCVPTAP
jgi:hypothetical protein